MSNILCWNFFCATVNSPCKRPFHLFSCLLKIVIFYWIAAGTCKLAHRWGWLRHMTRCSLRRFKRASVDYLLLASQPCVSGNSPVDICQWLYVMSPSGAENAHRREMSTFVGFFIYLFIYFCATPAVLRHFGTFIKCHHNRFLPFWTPLYICKKNFSTRAHAPVREHRLHVNAEQMWGDMRRCCWSVSVIFFKLWACWCLQLATPRAGTPECSCFTWSALPSFFSPQLECLMSCVVTGTVLFLHVMSWATLSTGKFIRWAPDPVWS